MGDHEANPSHLYKHRLVTGGLLCYFLASMTVVLLSQGTYDAGDSVMHYQIAHYAFQHPENLLSHWGKPFFTLVAAPFAALGYGGIKVFQCLLALGTGWMTYRSARLLELRPAWMAPLLALAAPEFFLSQLSGLTEPFFAFLLTLGVFLTLRRHSLLAAAALSMLPFVRTEGFLLLPVFGLYFLLRQEWKAIPFLGLGTVLYAVLGGIFLGDLLWIWTQNPYAIDRLNYGMGSLSHFPVQYLFIVGIPIYALSILGLALAPVRLVLGKPPKLLEELLLVLGPFLAYFVAHMYFWVSGVGHSMGLIRVMIGIVPLGALFALAGLDQLLQWLPSRRRWVRTILMALVAVYVGIFPFIPNPAAFHARDFKPTVDQAMLQEVGAWMREEGLLEKKIYTVHPSAAFYLGIDPFDPQRYRSLNRFRDDKPGPGCLILLDTWFGKVESGYIPADFDAQPAAFRLLRSWSGQEGATPIGMYLYTCL